MEVPVGSKLAVTSATSRCRPTISRMSAISSIAALGSRACGAGFEHEARPPGLLHVASRAAQPSHPIRREVDQPLVDESGERFAAESATPSSSASASRRSREPGGSSATMRWRSLLVNLVDHAPTPSRAACPSRRTRLPLRLVLRDGESDVDRVRRYRRLVADLLQLTSSTTGFSRRPISSTSTATTSPGSTAASWRASP